MTNNTIPTNKKNNNAALKLFRLKPLNRKTLYLKTLLTGASLAALLVSSGCATSSLLESDNHVSTTTTKQILSEDQIVAFGRPAQALPKTPNATMVIVGEKNSYVLTQGGT